MTTTANASTTPAYEIRRGDARGATNLGWLNSKHSFSFGQFRDPERMGYRSLRVINDDVVAPGGGFGEHGHADMEIISIVLDGQLAHRDSAGNAGVIRPGDVQVMSAGAGIRHSEMNGSDTDPVHFLQVWIEPSAGGAPPSYGQQTIPADERRNRWRRVVGPDAAEGAMPINQDATLAVADLEPGQRLNTPVGADRYGYLHVATGTITVDGETLGAGDALTFRGPGPDIQATDDAKILLFDLA